MWALIYFKRNRGYKKERRFQEKKKRKVVKGSLVQLDPLGVLTMRCQNLIVSSPLAAFCNLGVRQVTRAWKYVDDTLGGRAYLSRRGRGRAENERAERGTHVVPSPGRLGVQQRRSYLPFFFHAVHDNVERRCQDRGGSIVERGRRDGGWRVGRVQRRSWGRRWPLTRGIEKFRGVGPTPGRRYEGAGRRNPVTRRTGRNRWRPPLRVHGLKIEKHFLLYNE